MSDFPQGWTRRSVESICKRVTSGGTPSRRNAKFYRNGTINWFKTGELKDRALYESEEKITPEALEDSSAKVFPVDTVLLALYGDGDTITSLGLLRSPAATNQACCAMIVDKDVADPRFLFYALKHTREDLLRVVVGGAQRNLSGKLVREHQISVPDIYEQEAIAAVLGALDDKIEQNRRTGRAVERLARAAFKAWFVDFEPVTAKAAGASGFPGMPPAAFAALPDRLTDSPLGPVPEGWVVGTMGDVGAQRRNQVAPGEIGGKTPYIGLEHMPRRDMVLSEWGTAASVTSSKFRFCRGDVLFGKLRPYFHKVGPAPLDGVCSTDIVVLYPKRPEYAAWLLMFVSSDDFVAHTDRSSAGTKMPRTNWNDMSTFKVTVPCSALASAFREGVGPMLDLMAASIHESRTLAALRDYLLPRLLSGKVRVRPSEGDRKA